MSIQITCSRVNIASCTASPHHFLTARGTSDVASMQDYGLRRIAMSDVFMRLVRNLMIGDGVGAAQEPVPGVPSQS